MPTFAGTGGGGSFTKKEERVKKDNKKKGERMVRKGMLK